MTDEEKKEKMNELMNRISFALKDATLQQGFEIICKRISELEKENDCYKSLESHYDEIEEDAKAIAKENEELKAQIEKMKCCENCDNSYYNADRKYYVCSVSNLWCNDEKWKLRE